MKAWIKAIQAASLLTYEDRRTKSHSFTSNPLDSPRNKTVSVESLQEEVKKLKAVISDMKRKRASDIGIKKTIMKSAASEGAASPNIQTCIALLWLAAIECQTNPM